MSEILRCDLPPERARWSYLTRLGLPAVSRKKNFLESHVINSLLTKLVRFFLPLGPSTRKKELGQYPPIRIFWFISGGEGGEDL